jgi:hypothetical protein
MGTCPSTCPSTRKQTLLPKQVDEFYHTLFQTHHINGLLFLDQGKIFSRTHLNHQEMRKVESLVKHKNMGSRVYLFDTPSGPIPTIVFTQPRDVDEILHVDSILIDIQKEKRLLERIGPCSIFLHLFEMDIPNHQYMIKYKIDFPATQIRYYVTQLDTMTAFLSQLREVREGLGVDKSVHSSTI